MIGSPSLIFGVKAFPKIRLIQSNERGFRARLGAPVTGRRVRLHGSKAMNQLMSSKRDTKNATITMRTKEAAVVATLGLAVLARTLATQSRPHRPANRSYAPPTTYPKF